MAINANIRFYLDGQLSKSIEDINSIEIIASFENEGVQANITAEDWTFYNEDAVKIQNWINSGDIFQGVPFKIEAYNDTNTIVAFDGMLDLTNSFVDSFNDDLRVNCKIIKSEGLNLFFTQLQALSFDFLDSKGIFVLNDYQDCSYVVEKPLNLMETLVSSVILYLMVKELILQIKEISKTIAQAIAYATSGVTGSIASTIYLIATAIIQIAYATAIIIAILNLAKELFDSLIPIVRNHKTLNFQTAMSKVCDYLGYQFSTSIALLNKLYYLPSNPNIYPKDLNNFLSANIGTKKGIPRNTDAHYMCSSFFDLAKKMFNGKFAIVNGTVQFHEKGASYWLQNSTYQMPSVRPNTTTYNTSDVNADLLISFATDLNDVYTVDNYTGTTYEIQTTVTGLQDERNRLLVGAKTIDLDIALGNAKTQLSDIENALLKVGQKIDSVVNFFGGNSNLAGKVNAKLGMLKVSDNWHTVPKVLMLNGDKLDSTYRTTLSAKNIYNDYYAYDSFVLNSFGGQKELHREVEIPFGLNDFVQVVNNSYFYDTNGTLGGIEKLIWKPRMDKARVDYWIKKIYTTKLQETYIEP